MQNRLKTIETTKKYIEVFNKRDLVSIAALMDENCVFSRQTQPTIVGRRQIMSRNQKLFKRLERQGHRLRLISGIIDLPDAAAWPCIIGFLDGERFSVIILSVKPNGLINSIAVLLTPESVAKARPTEKIVEEEEKKKENVLNLTTEEVEERARGLRLKERKIKRRIEKEGRTPELIGKMMRLERAKEKLDYIRQRLKAST